ncbi:hypothetical protein X801_08657 [Opisthorchis viverrini]|uniref:Uncharacterized protein n=1 Tax=Opisthorchis viverrini TaxID=6198 RepID=A0A1S8WM71_OPIVI|nr:hypothetical protein X801_08657 [Opisthorchis viverrini]
MRLQGSVEMQSSSRARAPSWLRSIITTLVYCFWSTMHKFTVYPTTSYLSVGMRYRSLVRCVPQTSQYLTHPALHNLQQQDPHRTRTVFLRQHWMWSESHNLKASHQQLSTLSSYLHLGVDLVTPALFSLRVPAVGTSESVGTGSSRLETQWSQQKTWRIYRYCSLPSGQPLTFAIGYWCTCHGAVRSGKCFGCLGLRTNATVVCAASTELCRWRSTWFEDGE